MNEIIPADAQVIITTPGVEINNGVVFHGALSFEEWCIWAQQVLYLTKLNPWIIGDTLNYGEDMYGEDFAQIYWDFGLSEQTIANYRSVCRRVPHEARRMDDLSFGHHAIVAKLLPDEQAEWLDEAIDQSWRREDLTRAIREDRNEPKKEVRPRDDYPWLVADDIREFATKALRRLDEGDIEAAREFIGEILYRLH